MDEYYESSSDSEVEIVKSKKIKDNNIDSFEQEFDQFIEKKIRSDFKLKEDDKILDKEDFYDPNKDDEDEEFMQNLCRPNQSKNDNSKIKSDATLNCPCCMSLLSLETQRHVIYKNQYRTMFTFNCKIDKDNPVKEQSNKPSKKRMKNRQNLAIDVEPNKAVVYPVSCSICSTEVGVYDNDEVYHFFNCIAGY